MGGKMKIKPLRDDLKDLLEKHQLTEKYVKQKRFFEADTSYPSLNVEKLKPTHLNIYSFRIDKKWRAIFIFDTTTSDVEVVDINLHYYD